MAKLTVRFRHGNPSYTSVDVDGPDVTTVLDEFKRNVETGSPKLLETTSAGGKPLLIRLDEVIAIVQTS